MKKIIPAVLALLVLSLATRALAAGYSDRSTPYTFTGIFQKVKEGPRGVETLVLPDKNSGYNVFINTVDALKDKIIPQGYISQSLIDCIGNPEAPYEDPVKIVSPISRIRHPWISIPLPEAACMRLPP